MPVTRFDSGALRQPRLDARGMLEVPAAVAKTGVQSYTRTDGTVQRELRHPDDVFDAQSLSTLRGAAVTVKHTTPTVNPRNRRYHEVGVVMSAGERDADGQHVISDLSVREDQVARRVDSRELCEVSAGYTCDLEKAEPGATYEGQPYDYRQRSIKYNHVALLGAGEGRAGPTVRIRLDSHEAVLVDNEGHEIPPAKAPPAEEEQMGKIRIDAVEYECPEQTAAAVSRALEKQQGTCAELQTRLDAAEQKLGTVEAERDKLKGELAEATDQTRLDARVNARADLLGRARKVIDDESVRLDGLSDHEVRLTALKKFYPEGDFSKQSEAYVLGRFEALEESSRETRNDAFERARRAAAAPPPKGPAPEASDWDKKMEARANAGLRNTEVK